VSSEDDVPGREALLKGLDVPAPSARVDVVVDLDPAGAIHRALKQLGTAVACMSSHGRGRSGALLGSVANEVIARGHDALILVGPAVGRVPLGRGLLACIDETGDAELVSASLHWAELLREPLVLATVAEPVPDPVRPVPAKRLFGPDGDLDAFLESIAAPLRASGHEVVTAPIFDPIGPADGVHDYLREHPAALASVSSRGRTGVARLVYGSAAAAIVHRSQAPVLVVPRRTR
jgi:nucleotide-binding universal stress UspA family protein